MLREVAPEDVNVVRNSAIDAPTVARAAEIVAAIERGGEPALRSISVELGDLDPNAPLVLGRDAMDAALASIDAETRALLERAAARIKRFASAQRESLRTLDMEVPGGRAGHTIAPVDSAGCYAPGGRYALPSSVLMTATTARVAGVKHVTVATPRPDTVTLAACAIASADQVLTVGGAHAIAALCAGTCTPRCDVIVGPGNRWVTAAKQILAGRVEIDMLAGPSELLVIADDSADAAWVAADLIAQAEHDVDAFPALVATSRRLVEDVQRELARQLEEFPNADVARAAIESGCACVVDDAETAAAVSNRIAPEHLELIVRNPDAWQPLLEHYGALFIGAGSAEVFGDYGVGPNHVLPTDGAARAVGGLSVMRFLRIRTWLALDAKREDYRGVVHDARDFARLERLEGHARAAECRSR